MKKILFTLAIGLATLTSCESDLVNLPPAEDGTLPDNGEVGVLLKKVIDSDGVTTNMTYDGNKLMSISDNDGFSETFTYSGGLLTQVHEVHTDEFGEMDNDITVLEYDSNDKLISATTTFSDGGVQVDTYAYNPDGTITFVQGSSVYIYTIIGGNIIVENHTNGDHDYVSTYDAKNGYFKNIYQREVFMLLGDYAFDNNLLTYTNTGGAMYPDNIATTYTYNSANYPETSTTVYSPGTAEEESFTSQYFYE